MFTKRSMTALALALAATFAAAASAQAIDIPEGGDAVHYQLGASSSAVIARFVKRDNQGYSFEVSDTLRGSVPKTLVLEEDGYLRGYGFKAGQSYLLYLSEMDKKITLGTSIYSIQPVAKTEVTAYKQAMDSYVTNLQRREPLKSALKRQVESNVRYLQYSAVADLTRLQMLDKSDVADIGKLLAANKIADPRAKSLVVDSIAATGSREFIPVLESLAINKSEPTLTRGAALTALHRLNATDSLKKVAPSIVSEQSPALMRKLLPEGAAEKLRK